MIAIDRPLLFLFWEDEGRGPLGINLLSDFKVRARFLSADEMTRFDASIAPRPMLYASNDHTLGFSKRRASMNFLNATLGCPSGVQK